MNKHIIPHTHSIKREDLTNIKQHRPVVLWFTGLSGSGKSTIANAVEQKLNKEYQSHTYLLDGDNIRDRLNKDLGFSSSDREENIRRVGEVASLFYDAGLIVLTAFISPFQSDRNEIRKKLPGKAFIEIYVKCPIDICMNRDPKNLYKKAKQGLIKDFTGIDSPYEEPKNPELILDTSQLKLEESVDEVIKLLISMEILYKGNH